MSPARYLVASLAVERWGLGPKPIGDVLGRRGDVVSRWVRHGVELRRNDPTFAAAFDDLDQTLSETNRGSTGHDEE